MCRGCFSRPGSVRGSRGCGCSQPQVSDALAAQPCFSCLGRCGSVRNTRISQFGDFVSNIPNREVPQRCLGCLSIFFFFFFHFQCLTAVKGNSKHSHSCAHFIQQHVEAFCMLLKSKKATVNGTRKQ